MSSSNRDKLFADPLASVKNFVFDQAVADVFQDMVERSIPGYQTIINHTGELAHRFVKANTNCYDLGCSLGASTLAIRERTESRGVTIYAVTTPSRCLKNVPLISPRKYPPLRPRWLMPISAI